MTETKTSPRRNPSEKLSPVHLRRRIVAGAGLIAVTAAFGVGIAEGRSTDSAKQPELTYVVEPGDTLSSIVEKITNASDVREETFNLEQKVAINAEHPSSSVIQPGDKVEYRPDGQITGFVDRPSG